MSKEFTLPELGETIEAADVLKVLIKKGDIIKVDQPVLEIETDKATIEVPSTIGGVIKEVFVKEGQKVKVGQVVFNLEDSVTVSDAPELSSADTTEPKQIGETETNSDVSSSFVSEMLLPELGENITKADVLKVLVKAGSVIKLDEPVLEIETDKATIEVPSTVEGVIEEVFVKEGEKADVGQVVLKVSKSTAQIPTASPELSVQQEVVKTVPVAEQQPKVEESTTVPNRFIPLDTQPPILTDPAPAAPSVRRLARELGVDINKIPGSGPRGRISIEDVKAFVKNLNLSRKSTGESFISGIKAESLPDFSKFGSIEVNDMSNVRAKTAEHLSFAWATIPHVTQFDKADITLLEQMRKQHSKYVESQGAKLTVTAILIKVVTHALKKFPQFNASVDMEKKQIIYKKYYNVGVAVDTERGLIVPVIQGTDKLNVTEISLELQKISEKARNRKITPEDLQGGCFTISNLGGIGGTYFTPIVNSPEVAILGVSRSVTEPVYVDGKFEPRLMLPLSLSYDHRIIDGADAIRFLRWIVESLEQPMKLLIEG